MPAGPAAPPPHATLPHWRRTDVGVIGTQEIEQQVRLAAAGAEMNIRQEQCPDPDALSALRHAVSFLALSVAKMIRVSVS